MSVLGHRPLRLFSHYAQGRSYDLGQMDLRALIGAFFTYPIVLLYLSLSIAAAAAAVGLGILDEPVQAAITIAATFIVYAIVWYLLHRFVLHSAVLYRSPLTARLWKRIHYDHHQDPHLMSVLFGAPVTTLPTVISITGLLGWLIGGWSAAACSLLAGLVITLVYEFCHCCMHLNYTPRQRWLQRAKTLHMAHHFHNESGNYGIISFWPDRLFGTLYEDGASRPRSPTVFNLGYDASAAARFPWVEALTRRRPAADVPDQNVDA